VRQHRILKSTRHFQPTDLKERYNFVKHHSDKWPVQVIWQTLGLSRSAYYKWLSATSAISNPMENPVHKAIIDTFDKHRRRYGVRRIVAELQEKGVVVGSYQVRQVMKKNGLKAIQPCSFVPRTTDSRHPYPISPNLLLDRPFPVGPNQVWVGDITYIALSELHFFKQFS
jgi:hypothetical protein